MTCTQSGWPTGEVQTSDVVARRSPRSKHAKGCPLQLATPFPGIGHHAVLELGQGAQSSRGPEPRVRSSPRWDGTRPGKEGGCDTSHSVTLLRHQTQKDTQHGLQGQETPRTGDSRDRKWTQGCRGWEGTGDKAPLGAVFWYWMAVMAAVVL